MRERWATGAGERGRDGQIAGERRAVICRTMSVTEGGRRLGRDESEKRGLRRRVKG